ncbi:MAG: hypothetical protein ACR2L1_05915 [Pyrinomonadaceae bacterium]
MARIVKGVNANVAAAANLETIDAAVVSKRERMVLSSIWGSFSFPRQTSHWFEDLKFQTEFLVIDEARGRAANRSLRVHVWTGISF